MTKPAPGADDDAPRFTTGSTMGHVVVMTATGAAGLIAIFLVDLISLLYISWLRDPSQTAGVGLATVVMFLTISINVGLMIPLGALVSRALGARERERARRLAASGTVLMTATAIGVSLALLPLLDVILALLGASGRTLEVARTFLYISLPTNAVMALGMALASILRAAGDARRAMYATLSMAAVTLALDPVLIFGLGLEAKGAAITIGFARAASAWMSYRYVTRIHRLVARPDWSSVRGDARSFYAIAIPAILTNIAAPAANAFFTAIMARFGDQAIAATAIIDRVTPVAFGGLFALSGAIGPVMGQNWGARHFDRLRQTLKDAFIFMTIYVAIVWLALFLLRAQISLAFNAPPLTAEIVEFFCTISGMIWFFVGLVFVANASFNNLGFPLYSTFFNWGRATLGMIPFAYAGAQMAGPKGALFGIGVGSVAFGVAAAFTAFRTIRKLEARERAA